MRYVILIILLLYFASTGRAQSYYRLNDKVTINSPEGTLTAFTKPVKRAIRVENHKFYYWYSANEIRNTQGGYSGKVLNGSYSASYINKNLKEQGEFKKGLRTGRWKAWYANGKLKETTFWKSGLKQGAFSQYAEDGSIQKSGDYKNGELHGKVTSYIKDSIQVSHYKKGQLIVKPEKKKGTKNYNKLTKPFKKLFRKKKNNTKEHQKLPAGENNPAKK